MHGNKDKLKWCVAVLNEEQIFVAASSLAGNRSDNISVFPVILIKRLWSIPAKISPDAALVPVDSLKKNKNTLTLNVIITCYNVSTGNFLPIGPQFKRSEVKSVLTPTRCMHIRRSRAVQQASFPQPAQTRHWMQPVLLSHLPLRHT